ncbi:MAG: lipoyl(octanoyl) transferase LipB [Candidatus Kapabacteria bacterium]|nr:lipoyl(octanoyl) transferase LipB [Candidatus Kapabacteria bacterium]MDW8012309.1 lipoyl(octanoyl) transferase LipB [Bacteroidota bacterium]
MLQVEDWGCIPYAEAWQRQRDLLQRVQSRQAGNTLVLCEHPTVITIGRSGSRRHILLPEPLLRERGVEVYEVERGGDVTLHNPGQLVGYPIIRLSEYREDLHWFVREIEQCIIELLADFGISGHRVPGLTGVWIDGARKICAIGLHVTRWVSWHGFALNVNNRLEEFAYIVPCGIADKTVTSMARELGQQLPMAEVKARCAAIFRAHFPH